MDLSIEQLTKIISESVQKTLKNSYILPLNSGFSNNNKESNLKNDDSGKTYKLLNKKVIVEEDIKKVINQNLFSVEIMAKAIITPLALELLKTKKISIIKK